MRQPHDDDRSALAGGTLDIEALYVRHAGVVARWARRLGGPAVDAEDIAQEVFLIARRRLARFEGSGQITTWLFRTTERLVLAARRKARLRRILAGRIFRTAGALFGSPPTPAECIERRQITTALYGLLDRLPERQRQALILFEIEGLSTEEIARLSGAELSTVRSWLHRARARFAKLYAQWESTAPTRQGAA